MALPPIARLQAHSCARDVTSQTPSAQFEPAQMAGRMGVTAAMGTVSQPGYSNTTPVGYTGTTPVGYTVLEFNNPDASNPVSAVITEVAAVPQMGRLTHWRFSFLTQADFGVGMALNYGEGWAQRAMYINSSNGALCGRGLKSSNWVPSFSRAGAQVDMMIEVIQNRVKAYYMLDGVPRGMAFDLDFSMRPDLIYQLKPVVMCFSGTYGARIAITQFAPGAPSEAYKYRRDIINPACPAGEYQMEPEHFPGVNFPVHTAKIQVTPEGKLSFHVFNVMNNGAQLQAGGMIYGVQQNYAMTKMMPPPAYQTAEGAVQAWIGGLRTWRFADNRLTLNEKTFPLYTNYPAVMENELMM